MDSRVANPKGMFGGGLYFAEHSSKSNQYIECSTCKRGKIDTNKYCLCTKPSEKDYAILLCRVVLGNVRK